jgi:hypothetical protein
MAESCRAGPPKARARWGPLLFRQSGDTNQNGTSSSWVSLYGFGVAPRSRRMNSWRCGWVAAPGRAGGKGPGAPGETGDNYRDHHLKHTRPPWTSALTHQICYR